MAKKDLVSASSSAASSNHNAASSAPQQPQQAAAAFDHAGTNANEYFTNGSMVKIKTATNVEMEGEVLAFDPQTKMMIIKQPASNRRSSHNNIQFVNLSMCSEVSVTKEAPAPKSEDLPALNVPRLNSRAHNNVERKKRNAKAFKSGVPLHGQRLFQTIAKTIDEIDWHADNIVVMAGKVSISPPYKAENVKAGGGGRDADGKAVTHIRKIVEKHYEDQKRLAEKMASTSISSTPSPVSSTTPTSSSAASPTAKPEKESQQQQQSSTSSSSQQQQQQQHHQTQQQSRKSNKQKNSPSSRGGGTTSSSSSSARQQQQQQQPM